jgi:hypothetical protein
MNRRDFLFFRTEQRTQIVELSCERLYMRYLDSQVTAAAREERPTAASGDSWDGEPPAVLDAPTTRQLFDDLDRELHGVDLLHVIDSDWLAGDEFRREFDGLISAFRARGGRVEYSSKR